MNNDLDTTNNISEPSRNELVNLLKSFQEKQYDLAEKEAFALSKKFPNHPFAWTILGAVFNQAGKLKKALIAFQKAVELEPNKAEAHNNLGNTLLKLDRLEEAEESCRKATFLEPKNELALSNLGKILFRLKRYVEAEEAFKKAIDHKENNAPAYFNLGNTLKAQGKLEEAISFFEHATLLDPKNPDLYILRGLTPPLLARKPLLGRDDLIDSINNGNWENSEILLKQSFEENPSHTVNNVADFINLWCDLCRDLINQNKIEKLIPIFLKLLVIGERNKDLNNLISLFFDKFDRNKVLELLEPKDQILINLSYCQYNYLKENFTKAETIAIENIEKAESLIKFKETEDLGWQVVRISLSSFKQKNLSKKVLKNLTNNLINNERNSRI